MISIATQGFLKGRSLQYQCYVFLFNTFWAFIAAIRLFFFLQTWGSLMIPWGSSGRSGSTRSSPTCWCSRCTLPSWGNTGCPWSWADRTPSSSRCPLGRSNSGSGRRTCWSSLHCTPRSAPWSSCPHRRWSDEGENQTIFSHLYSFILFLSWLSSSYLAHGHFGFFLLVGSAPRIPVSDAQIRLV